MFSFVTAAMEFGDYSTLIPLVCLCGLALLGVMIATRISGHLARIERLLGRRLDTEEAQAMFKSQHSSRSSVGDFERFMIEDPSRRAMPKKDQFAAYRAWRKERGLSWGSGERELADEKETKR